MIGLFAATIVKVRKPEVHAMIHDWRTRGRPHKVYFYGLLLLVVEPLLAVWMSGTALWMTAARFLQHLAG